jgi:hypothetical protein
MEKIEQKYIDCIDAILNGLAESDFVTNAGALAMNELRQYRLDMALDIQKKLTV